MPPEPAKLLCLHGKRVMLHRADGPLLRDIGGAFFALHTGLAGEIVQKFVNYHVNLAVVGDISHHVAASTALRDFIREANAGSRLWFAADFADFEHKLTKV